jgi:hypothetical protein
MSEPGEEPKSSYTQVRAPSDSASLGGPPPRAGHLSLDKWFYSRNNANVRCRTKVCVRLSSTAAPSK